MAPDIRFSNEAVKIMDEFDGQLYRMLLDTAAEIAYESDSEVVTVEHVRRAILKILDILKKEQQEAQSATG
jgi:hypothetical protein